MNLVFTHENSFIVHNIRNILELNGIACEIKNDLVNAASGEVPPIEVWPQIWIKKAHQIEHAKTVIDEAIRGPIDKFSWRCPKCNEVNEPSFEICWQCSTLCP